MTEQLVTVKWLNKHTGDKNIILLDASTTFINPTTIPGSQHFDIKNVFSDTDSKFPNTFPTAAQFEKESRKLGIDKDSHIIVFDDKGIFTSPRVWWMFRVMGHCKVSVLDGGIPEWKNANLPIGNDTRATRTLGNFTATLNDSGVKSFEEVVQNTKTLAYTLIDARSAGRFIGTDPEPREHIKSGHIPNSLNLPYTEVLENGKYKSKKELQLLFDKFELSNKPIIFSCGSGISACIILFALELISDQVTSIFDGSWTEWAERQELFVT